MIIEQTIYEYLRENVDLPIYMEVPNLAKVKAFYTIEKTGSSKTNRLESSTFAVQSWSDNSLFESATMNEKIKQVIENMIDLDRVTKVSLNSDYNYTDTTTKHYRYQAVFNVTHY